MKKLIVAMLVVAGALVLFNLASRTADAAQLSDSGAQSQPSIDRQTDGEAPSADGDQTVPVQLWTIMAAGGACAVFLLLFFLRIALGRGPVASPPVEDAAHH